MRPRYAFDICHEVYRHARAILGEKVATIQLERASKFHWRPDSRPRLGEYVADFARAGERALREGRFASRLILFRVYYLGGAEYHAARRHLGLSELTFADWADEVRDRVGRELLRAGLFPPGKYFHARSRDA